MKDYKKMNFNNICLIFLSYNSVIRIYVWMKPIKIVILK